MRLFLKTTPLFFGLFLFTQSCKKFEKLDFSEAWNPDLAIPLAYSTFDVYDIFAKVDSSNLIVSDPDDGEISLVYSDKIASLNAMELFGDINFSENFSYSLSELNLAPEVNFTGTANSARTEILNFASPNGEELDLISFKSGFFNIHFQTDLKQDIKVTVTFPELKSGTTPITKIVNMNYEGVPLESDIQIDLTELNGDFTLNGTDHNKLAVDLIVKVTGDGTEDIGGTELFNATLESQDMNFHNITGYFGQASLMDQADSVLIKIFQNTDQEGHFELVNPRINFTIENGFGIPIDLHLDNLQTIQTFNGGQHLPLQGFPTPIAVETPTNVGDVTVTEFELNSSNTTNLNSIISPTPKYFYYEVNAMPNPMGKTSTPNFVDETSQLDIVADVNMPLEGYAYGFYIQDTVDFKIDEDPNKVEQVMFRLISDNGFPVNLKTQIMAINKNDKVIFNFFEQEEVVLTGASVDAQGKVIVSEQKIVDIPLNKEQIKQISNIQKLIIRGESFTTGFNPNDPPSSTNVKFYDSYAISLKLSMNLQLK